MAQAAVNLWLRLGGLFGFKIPPLPYHDTGLMVSLSFVLVLVHRAGQPHGPAHEGDEDEVGNPQGLLLHDLKQDLQMRGDTCTEL